MHRFGSGTAGGDARPSSPGACALGRWLRGAAGWPQGSGGDVQRFRGAAHAALPAGELQPAAWHRELGEGGGRYMMLARAPSVGARCVKVPAENGPQPSNPPKGPVELRPRGLCVGLPGHGGVTKAMKSVTGASVARSPPPSARPGHV